MKNFANFIYCAAIVGGSVNLDSFFVNQFTISGNNPIRNNNTVAPCKLTPSPSLPFTDLYLVYGINLNMSVIGVIALQITDSKLSNVQVKNIIGMILSRGFSH